MSVLDYRSGIEEFSDTSRARAGSWISWAVYLGMSWTWCIGMYLPVLLVRDYGVWAWLIFAIPNVIGAAAMGWVLKDHDSEAIVIAHPLAVKTFSLITAAFQVFFALWMFEDRGAAGAEWATVLFALLVLRASRREQDVQGLARVVLTASLVTMLFGGMQGLLAMPAPVPLKSGNALDLVALAPVCFLGFFLCPYLDASFHRARQHLVERQAKAAFTVGFGCFFFLMILYSLLYTRLFQFNAGGSQLAGVIGHWIVQLGFTIGVHWYGLPREGEREARSAKWARVAISMLLGTVAWIPTADGTHALDGETIYRCFLGFYGLLFPAYVWICMIPGRGSRMPGHRQWVVLGITVALATPMYWLGFVERRMLWLLPGVAIVLLGRLFIKPSHLKDVPVVEIQPEGK